MFAGLAAGRLVLAIISNCAEEAAIYAAWRWLLPRLGIYLPVPVLILVMVGWAVFATWLFIFTSRTFRKEVPAGLPSMVGMRGKAATPLLPEGMVKVGGELWGAVSTEGRIEAGTEVLVTAQDGLKLFVCRSGAGSKR